ncbi:MAG: S8 family serine peptidase [Jatrophihabitans sp.]|uniref:S8 family serine peptidase n=1 Tax=Jatrophihabitans sp. TaxID=1932789 RepID=UPI0039127977
MRARVPFSVTVALLVIAGTTSALATPTSVTAAHSGSTRLVANSREWRGPKWPGSKPRAAAHRDVRALAAGRTHAAPTTALDPNLTADARSLRNVEVTVSGATTRITSAIAAVNGKVIAAVPGKVTAQVPRAALSRLAASAGVEAVDKPVRGFAQSTVTSEGVAASNAGPAATPGTWQQAGDTGSGVAIAIIDGGFQGLAAAVTAGDLPAGLTITGDHCADSSLSSHGTAVAEIVHQMAPDATLHLYCVDDSVGVNQVVTDELALPVHDSIVSCSLGFPGDGRGDGTGASGSVAAAVRKARQAGILWVEAAGNSASDHWGGTLADADADGLVDLDGSADEVDGVLVAGTNLAGPSGGQADLHVQWDQWPASSAPLSIAAFPFQCTDAACDAGYDLPTVVIDQPAGAAPWLEIPVSNTAAFDQEWDVAVFVDPGFPKVRYDLTYLGDVSPSYLSGQNPARAASRSIASPADSPYALAVGAADVGLDGFPAGSLEPFSSQGPTIDGRAKPDITGWDGVSSPVYGVPSPGGGDGFFGTSAAAPHVVGAAALVAGANPNLDAAQIQNFLEQRANSGAPNNPPTNTFGHGLLTLGAPSDVAAPPGSRYQPTGPTRILDTRTTTGGHKAPLGAGGTVQVTVPGLPADATAVAVNITGTGPTANTYLSAYAGNMPFPNTVNLALPKVEVTASVFAIVAVKSGKITLRNSTGSVNVVVDEVGYFGTAAEPGLMTSFAAPSRVLDTRTTVGGHHAKIASGGTVTVTTGAPAGATAALVNLTTIGMLAGGRAGGGPSCASAWSTLYYSKYVRSNQAIVKLSPAGQFCLKVTGGTADFIVDVEGYLGASGSHYVALGSPQRIVDTRTGTGGFAGGRASLPLAPGGAQVIYGSNLGDVPASATTLVTNLLEVSATATGYLGHYPGSSRPSGLKSVLSFTAGRTVSNAAFVGLPPGTAAPTTLNRFGLYNSAGTTNAVVDLSGYFLP